MPFHLYGCSNIFFQNHVKYECDKAVEAGIKIIVLYKAATVDKSKCPDAVANVGTHVAMCYRKDGDLYWDYDAVKKAFDD